MNRWDQRARAQRRASRVWLALTAAGVATSIAACAEGGTTRECVGEVACGRHLDAAVDGRRSSVSDAAYDGARGDGASGDAGRDAGLFVRAGVALSAPPTVRLVEGAMHRLPMRLKRHGRFSGPAYIEVLDAPRGVRATPLVLLPTIERFELELHVEDRAPHLTGWKMRIRAVDERGRVLDETRVRVTVAGPSGSLDRSFTPSGMRYYRFSRDERDALRDVWAAPDGELLLAGYGYGGAALRTRAWLARVTSSGEMGAAFGVGGVLTSASTAALDVHTQLSPFDDGGHLIAGLEGPSFDGARIRIERRAPTGQLDPSFGLSGRAYLPAESRTEARARSRGFFLRNGPKLEAYGMNARLDLGFAAGGVLETPFASGFTYRVGGEGDVFLAGRESGGASLMHVRADGSIDPGYGVGGRGHLPIPIGETAPWVTGLLTRGLDETYVSVRYERGGAVGSYIARVDSGAKPTLDFSAGGFARFDDVGERIDARPVGFIDDHTILCLGYASGRPLEARWVAFLLRRDGTRDVFADGSLELHLPADMVSPLARLDLKERRLWVLDTASPEAIGVARYWL